MVWACSIGFAIAARVAVAGRSAPMISARGELFSLSLKGLLHPPVSTAIVVTVRIARRFAVLDWVCSLMLLVPSR